MAGFHLIMYGRFPETSLFKVGDFDVRRVVRGARDGLLLLLGRCRDTNGLLPGEGGSSVWAPTVVLSGACHDLHSVLFSFTLQHSYFALLASPVEFVDPLIYPPPSLCDQPIVKAGLNACHSLNCFEAS